MLTTRGPRGQRSQRGERGAVLVEGAFAVPIILLIVLAVLEFGMYFTSASATTSASRDGARYGVAHYARRSDPLVVSDEIRQVVERDLGSLTGFGTPTQMWIYRAEADGSPAGVGDCEVDCARYTWDGSAFAYDVTSDPWDDANACLLPGVPIDDLGVIVEVRHRPVSGTIGTGVRTIRERTVLRLEPLPTPQC